MNAYRVLSMEEIMGKNNEIVNIDSPIKIQKMTEEHAAEVLEMMRVFYTSPAVHTNGSEEIFQNDIDACVGSNPFLDGYVFVEQEKLLGYAMTANSFSTEFGKPCIWIEDLYLKPEARGRGIGMQFLTELEKMQSGVLLRLEAEEENIPAVKLYKKVGFEVLPYLEMKKEV